MGNAEVASGVQTPSANIFPTYINQPLEVFIRVNFSLSLFFLSLFVFQHFISYTRSQVTKRPEFLKTIIGASHKR